MSRNGKDLLTDIKKNVAGIRLQWDLVPEEITSLTEAVIEQSKAIHDQVAANVSNPTWENTLQLFTEDDALFHVVESILTFPQHVSTDKALRDASTAAEEKLSAFQIEMSSRFDVYQAIKAYEAKNDPLEGEKARYLSRALRDYRRKGLHLEEEIRAKVLALSKKIKELEIEYQKYLGEENTKISFSKEELSGLADDFLSGLERDGEKYAATLKYPHYLPIMKLCKVSSTRQTMEKAFNSRCIATNTKILEELVTLRHERANLLGYPNHASYITEIRMAKTPHAVMAFLEELSQKLTPLADAEMTVLLDFKKRDVSSRGEEFDGKINAWDMAFYRNLVEIENYKVDHEQIKPYFPIAKVTTGLLEIYQDLLGLKFIEITGSVRVWHEDVRTFKVVNQGDESLVGYFYLDMHPREGKYSHAACFGLQPSCVLDSNNRMVPVAAMVCNFTKPTAENPSLLTHDEVETFFHEFGHVCHQICSLSELTLFAGTAVERDFVEAPSQMLENWVWDEAALMKLSGRLSDGAPLPKDLLDSLIKGRNANAGVINKRQVLLATFDMTIHQAAKADTAGELGRLTKEICGFNMTEGTNMSASFGHLAGGYDASYYGYLWSEVFSMDMFETRFKKEGIFNPKVGLDYRNKILRCGGSKDGSEMIRNFLGRDPTPDAFLKSKGL